MRLKELEAQLASLTPALESAGHPDFSFGFDQHLAWNRQDSWCGGWWCLYRQDADSHLDVSELSSSRLERRRYFRKLSHSACIRLSKCLGLCGCTSWWDWNSATRERVSLSFGAFLCRWELPTASCGITTRFRTRCTDSNRSGSSWSSNFWWSSP